MSPKKFRLDKGSCLSAVPSNPQIKSSRCVCVCVCACVFVCVCVCVCVFGCLHGNNYVCEITIYIHACVHTPKGHCIYYTHVRIHRG